MINIDLGSHMDFKTLLGPVVVKLVDYAQIHQDLQPFMGMQLVQQVHIQCSLICQLILAVVSTVHIAQHWLSPGSSTIVLPDFW